MNGPLYLTAVFFFLEKRFIPSNIFNYLYNSNNSIIPRIFCDCMNRVVFILNNLFS